MKHFFLTASILLATALLPAGCRRGAPEDTPPQAETEPASPMVLAPDGWFVMGDAKGQIDETPHKVHISSFYIDRHLVSQQEYQRVMDDNPSRWKGKSNPVEQVRWSDAVKYCNARSRLEGLDSCYNLETWQCDFQANGYRLPTEAEWEYACRTKCSRGKSTEVF